jgi:Protein of unknown function (DUF3455)
MPPRSMATCYGIATDMKQILFRTATTLTVLAGTAWLAGCATAPADAPASPPETPPSAPGAPGAPSTGAAGMPQPRLGFFSRIKAPDTVMPVLALSARGVQIFRCESREGGPTWVFRQPEADLTDTEGRVVARHGANFSFEHTDGSRILASVASFDEPPESGNLRWLLMTSKSFGDGALGGVTHIQRVNTTGGMPPPQCDKSQLNRIMRVDFTADFVFYRPR